MKTDTIQVCIDALELAREFINAADDWNFDEAEINGEWIRNTRVFARIDQAIADLEAATQAEPHAMPNADGLAPCPFCGGEGKISIDYVLGPEEPLYTAMCEKLLTWHDKRFTNGYEGRPRCGGLMSGAFNTREEAVAAWNQRTPASPATTNQEE